MSGGGGGGGEQTNTTEPWKNLKPHLAEVYQGAQQTYYNQRGTPTAGGLTGPEYGQAFRGVYGQSPTGMAGKFGLDQQDLTTAVNSGLSPFTQTQQTANQMGIDRGLSGTNVGYDQAQNRTTKLMQDPFNTYMDAGGGAWMEQVRNPLTQPQQASLDVYRGLADQPMSQGQQQALDFAGNAISGDTDAMRYFQSEMGGDFVGQNPYISQAYEAASRPMIEQWKEEIAPSLDARFALSGRYGSDAMQNSKYRSAEGLGRSLAQLGTGLYGEAYEADRNRQMAGANQLLQGQMQGAGLSSSVGEQDYAQRAAAAAGMADIGSAKYNQQYASAGGLVDLGNLGQQTQMTAAQTLPGIIQARDQEAMQNLGLLSSVGDREQAMINDMLGRTDSVYEANRRQAYDDLAEYSALLNGVPGGTTSSQPYYRNQAAGIAGGAVTGGTTGAMMGSSFGPWGTAIGGGVGLLGGGLLGYYGS